MPPVSHPPATTPSMSAILAQFDPLHTPPAQTPPPPPPSSPSAREPMRNLGNRKAMQLHRDFHSGGAGAPPAPTEKNHLDESTDEMMERLTRAADAELTPTQLLHAGSLQDELAESKKGDVANQRSLLGKAADFLKSLPDPVQSLIDHKTARLMNEPHMQDTLHELDDLKKQAEQLEADQHDKPAPANPAKPPAATTPPAHATKPPAAQPSKPSHAHQGGVHQQMSQLEALEQEQAALNNSHDDVHSPSAKLKAKEIEIRIAMLMENILSMMKMIVEINKRANQIATSAI